MSLLATARKRRKLTQHALAAKLGMPQSVIAEWESRRRPVTVDRVASLAEVLDLDPLAIEIYSGRLPAEFRDLDPRRVLKSLRALLAHAPP